MTRAKFLILTATLLATSNWSRHSQLEEEAEEDDGLPPLSILEGMKCNKNGKIVDRQRHSRSESSYEGDAKKICQDAESQCDDRGPILGQQRATSLAVPRRCHRRTRTKKANSLVLKASSLSKVAGSKMRMAIQSARLLRETPRSLLAVLLMRMVTSWTREAIKLVTQSGIHLLKRRRKHLLISAS